MLFRSAFDETINANDGTLTNMDAATDWVLADHTPYEIVAYGTTAHVGVLPGADADGDPLAFSIVTNGTLGTATVDAATGAFTYQATSAVTGTDSFVYSISDGTNTVNETVDVKLEFPPLFAPVGTLAGVADTGIARSAVWGDYDGDGDLDLFVPRYSQTDILYRNDGDVGADGDIDFSDQSTAAGVASAGYNIGAAWGDYDGDGDLDLYVVNNTAANLLWRNDGDVGSDGDIDFTNQAVTAGVNANAGIGVSWGDYDGDGDLDLFLTQPGNTLYRNNGDGTFTNETTAAGVTNTNAARGVAWADYDDDGDLDVFVEIGRAHV